MSFPYNYRFLLSSIFFLKSVINDFFCRFCFFFHWFFLFSCGLLINNFVYNFIYYFFSYYFNFFFDFLVNNFLFNFFLHDHSFLFNFFFFNHSFLFNFHFYYLWVCLFYFILLDVLFELDMIWI